MKNMMVRTGSNFFFFKDNGQIYGQGADPDECDDQPLPKEPGFGSHVGDWMNDGQVKDHTNGE